jgi:hypothetical protein
LFATVAAARAFPAVAEVGRYAAGGNMAQSAEMETLDQLLGGEMPLSIIRRLFESDQSFARGILGLLQSGDVRLLDASHVEVPQRRWRSPFIENQVLNELSSFTLDITRSGAAKVT